jgi:hypothetical protein
MRFFRWLYGLLLNLFPRTYREEYGDELQAVFNLSLDDAMKIGGMEVAGVILCELIGLPTAILYEHWRERRRAKITGKFASRFDLVPGSRNEILAALAPFFVFGMLPVLLGYFRAFGMTTFGLVILIALFWVPGVSLFAIGFAKGAPRWFMPYLGFPLPIICVLAFNTFVNPEWRGFPFLYEAPWFVRQFAYQGLLWVGLFISILVIFLLTQFVPRMRPFHQRLRADWTLLCFILYGALPLVIVISFEEYRNEEPFLLLSFLVLVLSGWFYLRSATSWVKFWSLLIGLTLAMSIAVIGKTLLYESSFPGTNFPRWTSTLGTVIIWMWMVLFMFISAAFGLLPRSDHDLQTTLNT